MSEVTLRVGDARELLDDLDDESIQLTVTSPPYNVGIDYGDGVDDRTTLDDWTALIEDVFEELFRVTKPDGKVAVNVGGSFTTSDEAGRYQRIKLDEHVTRIARDVGFDVFDEYLWIKNQYQSDRGSGTIFGSYPYPTNFMASQRHEYVLVFRKWVSEDYHATRDRPEEDIQEESRLPKHTWREYTQSVWEFPGVQDKSVHPAPFPRELPRRLIRLYSFVGDTVLDPFVGSGTTPAAAKRWNRSAIGFDVSDEYIQAARERLEQTTLGEASDEHPQRTLVETDGGRTEF